MIETLAWLPHNPAYCYLPCCMKGEKVTMGRSFFQKKCWIALVCKGCGVTGLQGYRVVVKFGVYYSQKLSNSKLKTRNYLNRGPKEKAEIFNSTAGKNFRLFVDNFMLRPQEKILHASERLMSVANCVDPVRAEA